LYSLSQGRQPATLDDLRQLLQTQHYTLADLQRTLQEKLETDQLEQIKGMAGALITPQEVSDMYDHDHQQYVAEAVFFPVTNYLARVQAPAAVVAQFYTNYMALYREPVRVQVNYVFFGISNYLAQAKLEWSRTNFEDIVTGYYNAHLEDFINEKTPEAAKVKIREELVRERAAMDAHGDANVFASKVFGQVQAGDLSVEAKKAGYVVRTSRPFSAEEQPADLEVNPGFVKEAFKLNAETPAAGPLATTEGFYVISLAQQFPSRIPEFTEIRGRVEQDYRGQQALRMAQDIGTNFAAKVAAKVASGGTFAQAAAAFGAPVVALPVFSLSTQPEDAPELGDQMQLESLKQTAFATLPGKVSGFVGTGTGGFVLHVKSIQPAEADKKAKNLPDFTAELRRMRINSAFNLWLESECNREFRGIPLLQPKNSPAAAGR